MAYFCETCPVRGACAGAIIDQTTIDVGRFYGGRQLLATRCFDDSGNCSEPFPSDEVDIVDKIEKCEKPQIAKIRTGIISKKSEYRQGCGALADFPHFSEYPDLKESYEYGLRIASGAAEIDRAIGKVESKTALRWLGIGAFTTAVSTVAFTGGDFISNPNLMKAGLAGFALGLLTMVGTAEVAIKNIEKNNSL